MRVRSRLAALALLALVPVGCATMNVSSHVERGVDFAQYKTYDWGPADALPTGDPGSTITRSSTTTSRAPSRSSLPVAG